MAWVGTRHSRKAIAHSSIGSRLSTHIASHHSTHAIMQAHHVMRRLTAADIPKAHELEVLSYPEVSVRRVLDGYVPIRLSALATLTIHGWQLNEQFG